MRGAVPFVLLPLLAISAGAEQTGLSPQAALSLPGYLARLDTLTSEVGEARSDDRGVVSELLSRVPLEWIVTAGGESWRVPASPLRSAMVDWQRRPDAESQEAVLICLRVMHAQAASFEPPPADSTLARDALAEILRADEFRSVRGPSALDRFWQQLQAWLVSILTRVFGSSLTPTLTNIAVYLVIGFAVAAAGLWMYRALRHTATTEASALEVQGAVARPWEDWLTEAQADAAGGRWADAVRRVYWCGIAFLEARGAWRPDASRTPREYLVLMPPGDPAAGLRGLTHLMERVWYGHDAASASNFDEAVACLRSMGCPSA